MNNTKIDIVRLNIVKEDEIEYNVNRDEGLRDPEDMVELFKKFFGGLPDTENVLIVNLDNKNKPLSVQHIGRGSINQSVMHPREVFKSAIISNANSVAVIHNHPSGDVTPSSADISITGRLKWASDILLIDLLDHVIVGYDNFYSFNNHFRI